MQGENSLFPLLHFLAALRSLNLSKALKSTAGKTRTCPSSHTPLCFWKFRLRTLSAPISSSALSSLLSSGAQWDPVLRRTQQRSNKQNPNPPPARKPSPIALWALICRLACRPWIPFLWFRGCVFWCRDFSATVVVFLLLGWWWENVFISQGGASAQREVETLSSTAVWYRGLGNEGGKDPITDMGAACIPPCPKIPAISCRVCHYFDSAIHPNNATTAERSWPWYSLWLRFDANSVRVHVWLSDHSHEEMILHAFFFH